MGAEVAAEDHHMLLTAQAVGKLAAGSANWSSVGDWPCGRVGGVTWTLGCDKQRKAPFDVNRKGLRRSCSYWMFSTLGCLLGDEQAQSLHRAGMELRDAWLRDTELGAEILEFHALEVVHRHDVSLTLR